MHEQLFTQYICGSKNKPIERKFRKPTKILIRIQISRSKIKTVVFFFSMFSEIYHNFRLGKLVNNFGRI
jgi:hypothetical protein